MARDAMEFFGVQINTGSTWGVWISNPETLNPANWT